MRGLGEERNCCICKWVVVLSYTLASHSAPILSHKCHFRNLYFYNSIYSFGSNSTGTRRFDVSSQYRNGNVVRCLVYGVMIIRFMVKLLTVFE